MTTLISTAPAFLGLFACCQLIVAGVIGLCLVNREPAFARH